MVSLFCITTSYLDDAGQMLTNKGGSADVGDLIELNGDRNAYIGLERRNSSALSLLKHRGFR